MAQRYRLHLDTLKFCSLVDEPAQPNAKVLAIKRNILVGKDAGKEIDQATVKATAKFIKANDELGLAFFWAFTSTNPDGSDHFDLQNDTIDRDFMKAAMEWCLAGAPIDEMHDEQTTKARTVFAMPMDPDIAKIYGITTKQSGLMIAIKPTEDQLAKLKDGTFTGVSIGGTGYREAVKAKETAAKGHGLETRVAKHQLYTTEVDGHQHTISIDDCGELWCSWATAEGAENGHSHGVMRDETGALVILADSGHAHDLAEGQPAVVVVPEGAVIITARAPYAVSPTTIRTPAAKAAPKSTPIAGSDKVVLMKTAEEQLADLQKRHDRFERIAKMSGAQKAHFDTLAGDEAEAFLAKSNSERLAVIKAAQDADPIEVEFNGQVFRKSAGAGVVELAKTAKAQAEQIEKADVRKAALEHLGNLAGDDDTHDLIVRSLRKSGATPEAIAKAFVAMKGWNALAKSKQTAPGIGGTEPDANDTDQVDAEANLAKGLEAFCAEQKITKNLWTTGLDAFVQTEKGAALKRALDESLNG